MLIIRERMEKFTFVKLAFDIPFPPFFPFFRFATGEKGNGTRYGAKKM